MRFTREQVSKMVDEKTAEGASLLREASATITTQEGMIADLKKQVASTRTRCMVYIICVAVAVAVQQIEVFHPGSIRTAVGKALQCLKLPCLTP
jgi:hypothetical protein